MAQLVERVLGKDEVTGSNPVSSSIKRQVSVRGLSLFCFSNTIAAYRLCGGRLFVGLADFARAVRLFVKFLLQFF